MSVSSKLSPLSRSRGPLREGIELECSTTIGYRHGEDTPVPEQLAALMDSLHQQGLSRLVLEMNARQHEVLERALKGDLQAQNEVNSGSAEDRSRWWNRLAGSKLSLSRQICLARGGKYKSLNFEMPHLHRAFLPQVTATEPYCWSEPPTATPFGVCWQPSVARTSCQMPPNLDLFGRIGRECRQTSMQRTSSSNERNE